MDRVGENACGSDPPSPSASLASQQRIAAPLWAMQLGITPVTIRSSIPFGQPSWVQSSVTRRAPQTSLMKRLPDCLCLLGEINQFPALGTHRCASAPLPVRPSANSSKAPPIPCPSRRLHQRRHHILPAPSHRACRSANSWPVRSIHTISALFFIHRVFISPTFHGR